MEHCHRFLEAKLLSLIAIGLILIGCESRDDRSADLQSLIQIGQQHMRKGRYRQAIATFEKIAHLHPDAPEPYLRLALLHEEYARDPLTALAYYRKYRQLEEDAIKKHEVQGWIRQLEQKATAGPGQDDPVQGDTPAARLEAVAQAPDAPSGLPDEALTREDLQARLQAALQRVRMLEAQNGSKSDTLRKLAEAEERAEQLESENQSLARELHSAEAKAQQLQSGADRERISLLATELQNVKRQLSGSQSEKADADGEITRLKRSLNTYAATLSSLQKNYDDLKRENAALRARLSTAGDRIRHHTVRSGETLKSIAADPSVYGDSRKWILIYRENKDKIRNPNKLTPGQVLVIPPG